MAMYIDQGWMTHLKSPIGENEDLMMNTLKSVMPFADLTIFEHEEDLLGRCLVLLLWDHIIMEWLGESW